MISAFVLLACLAVTSAATLDGRFGCPDLQVVQDFNVANFTGTWYQQMSVNSFIFQGPGDCTEAEYSLNEATGSVDVLNSMVIRGIGGLSIPISISGTAALSNPESSEGKLTVTLNTLMGQQSADLWVLDTDYDNYAVLFSCKKLWALPMESAWVLTRSRQPSEDTWQAVENAVQDIANEGGPARRMYLPTNQRNC